MPSPATIAHRGYRMARPICKACGPTQPPRRSSARPSWASGAHSPKQEAAAISKAAIAAVEADAAPSDPDKKIEATQSLPPVGNYNLFWTDRGMTVAHIDGEYRTSMIIEPSNGRIPPLTAAGQQRTAARAARNPNDGPEGRALGERCLLSFGSASGPPMLPVMYNSYYQIVQSPGYVVILVEMVHDARIIRIQDPHAPGGIKKWMGDSVGHWEGDTLVVETRNFRPEQSFRGSSENAVVTERFTRVAKDKIVYRFTVDDPATFTSAFTGELPFITVDANIYEYACHEGNYALPGILSGAREAEKECIGRRMRLLLAHSRLRWRCPRPRE